MNDLRPRVTHIIHGFGAGGAERVVLELASRLGERGFNVDVVTVLGGGEMEPLFRERGIPYRILTRRGFGGWRTFVELIRLFRETRPHIVHTHLFLADTWGRLAAFIARVPVIISTEHNVNRSYAWFHHVVNRILTWATTVHVAISADVKAYLIEVEGIRADRVRFIQNGIDLASVIPRGTRPFRDVPHLLAVGRLYEQKDYPTLLKALALVKRPWLLSVAGIGPLLSDLRSLAERLRIAPRIRWLGYRDDIPELFAGADLFCLPSRYEGLGIVAIEAAAAGVPAVVSDLPALHEIFIENEATFVRAGDVPGWACAIGCALDDPSAVILRAARAVPRIHATFSVDRMVDQYAELYHSFLRT